MATYDQKAADLALRLIKAKGAPRSFARIVATPNPVTGEATEVTTNGTMQAVVLPAKSSALNALSGDTDNWIEAVIRGKGRFLLAAAKGITFEPETGDIIDLEAKKWRIIGITPLRPANIAILYKIGAILV
jgi:gentisate 1,2-dioxygenase